MMRSQLENIVGKEHVIDDPEALQGYTPNRSLVPSKRPSFAVRPHDTEEVQSVVVFAAEKRIPIVPLSSGVDYYGAAIPEQGGILLDLRRMNRILKIDERNRAVKIEPGVTWGHLQDELERHGLRALNPLLPHALKSALTSHLEGEPMLIPKFEYGEPIYTMEVVLPSGEILRTGSAAGLGSIKSYQADQVGPYGPGIDFARLFQGAQGTLGVVTSMNVKAEPLPRIHRLFFAAFDTLDRLVAYMYAVQRRLLGYECFALNAFNVATILAEKWPEDFQSLRKTLPPWCLIHSLGGTVRLPEEKVAYEEEDLKEVAQGFGVDLKSHIPDVTSSETIISKYLRRPWDSEPYWKDRYRGGCSDIFFYTTLDRTEEFADTILGIAKSYDRDFGEIGTYIQPIEHGRACHLEFNIPYNPAKPDETKIARVIHDEACRELVDKGAFFTRPYGSWADVVYNKSVGYSLVSKQMKAMFDPNNIMNPGRLCF